MKKTDRTTERGLQMQVDRMTNRDRENMSLLGLVLTVAVYFNVVLCLSPWN